MENQMNVEVEAVEENRGTCKVGKDLIVVPDSHSYVIRLRLEDGRSAYLTGSGEPPYQPGEQLGVVAR
jgi:hypothetical protein